MINALGASNAIIAGLNSSEVNYRFLLFSADSHQILHRPGDTVIRTTVYHQLSSSHY